jgi:hypothetical protein
MNARSAALAVLFPLVVVTAACSDDHDHDHADDAMPPSCEAFHEACVRASKSNPAAAECDDFTHGAGRTEAECAAKKDECTATCSGSADAGTD